MSKKKHDAELHEEAPYTWRPMLTCRNAWRPLHRYRHRHRHRDRCGAEVFFGARISAAHTNSSA